jgi:hypothetical protein
MPAYNKRLQTKEIFGFSLYGAIGALVAFVFGVLSLMVPIVFKVFTIPIALIAFFVAFASFWFGDDLQFLKVMWLARTVEPNRVSSETRTDN